MKLFKCAFNYDNGMMHSYEVRYVFSKTGNKGQIWDALNDEYCRSYDEGISELTIEEIEPYENMVL